MSSTAQSPALSAVKRSLIVIVPVALFESGSPLASFRSGVGRQALYSPFPLESLPAWATLVLPFSSVNTISTLSWPFDPLSLRANSRQVGRLASTHRAGETATPLAPNRSEAESDCAPT